jgi:hypothetical protein
MVSLFVLDRLCPWKKLVISAEFKGILPKEAREKARAAKDQRLLTSGSSSGVSSPTRQEARTDPDPASQEICKY